MNRPIQNRTFAELKVGDTACIARTLTYKDIERPAIRARCSSRMHPSTFFPRSKIPSTVEAGALCKMADRGQITGGILDGPLAFDNAVSLEAARTKGLVSPVAGQADIFVVPDLESGNMLAKQLEYLA